MRFESFPFCHCVKCLRRSTECVFVFSTTEVYAVYLRTWVTRHLDPWTEFPCEHELIDPESFHGYGYWRERLSPNTVTKNSRETELPHEMRRLRNVIQWTAEPSLSPPNWLFHIWTNQSWLRLLEICQYLDMDSHIFLFSRSPFAMMSEKHFSPHRKFLGDLRVYPHFKMRGGSFSDIHIQCAALTMHAPFNSSLRTGTEYRGLSIGYRHWYCAVFVVTNGCKQCIGEIFWNGLWAKIVRMRVDGVLVNF